MRVALPARRIVRPLWTFRPFAWAAAALGLLVAATVIVAPLDAVGQLYLTLGGILLYLLLNRLPGRRVTLMLAAISATVSLRYLHWRLTETLDFDSVLAAALGYGLVLAEVYAILVLFLGYMQTIWPLDRKPAPLPADPALWPTIDVYIPSYNESLEVVKPTVFAALAMDWPPEKLNVYILDDGRREEFRAFARACGAGYIIRPDNKGAKAGNINHALAQTKGEFIAIFDCDHAPTRGFLQLTLGWLLRDRKLAMVQTPHYFYSPDPFERNLHPHLRVPNEGLMFYGLVQPGNDLWNASFFCGSCAVIRREAMEQAGGVPTSTVTEDCHLSLRMQRLGWNNAYLRLPLASGLATERLAIHIGQRMRWARGMLQILRTENPLTGRGLTWDQRLCYFAATAHFLFALPRIVFLTAPLAYLLFGVNIVAAAPLAIVAYAAPHIFHSVATGSRVTGHVRHAFWSEIYESALALWLVPVTIMTLWDPKKGKFNVTDKGGTLDKGYLDIKVVWPSIALAVLLLLGIGLGLYGIATESVGSTDFQANLLNSFWAMLCLIPVFASIGAGCERQQRRRGARVQTVLPAAVTLPGGKLLKAKTIDLSLGGAAIAAARPATGAPSAGTLLPMALDLDGEVVHIPTAVVRWEGERLQLRFAPRDMAEEGRIAQAVLGRADAWLDWDTHRPDHPMRSIREVVVCSLRSLGVALRSGRFTAPADKAAAAPATAKAAPAAPAERRTEVVPPRSALAAVPTLRRAAAILLGVTAGLAPGWSLAQQAPPRPTAPVVAAAPAPAPSGTRQLVWTLRQLGQRGPLQLRGAVDQRNLHFGLRGDEVVTSARLVISGAFSPNLIPELSEMVLTINDQVVGAVQPDRTRPVFGPIEMAVNPLYFTDTNRIGVRFAGSYTRECQDPVHGLLWATLSDLTALHLTLEQLPATRDLGRLPEPFFDPRITHEPLTLPVVMAEGAAEDTIRAAVIATSWFAVQADYRGAAFPVSAAPPSRGHAIVLAIAGEAAPAGVTLPAIDGPTLALLPNPNDPYGLLLVIGGRDAAEAIGAASVLAAGGASALSGEIAQVQRATLPARAPYDAPRWIRADRPVRLGEIVDLSELQVQGYTPSPVRVPLRTAPDLQAWRNRPLDLSLIYRGPHGPVLDLAVSRLDVSVSETYLRSLPLGPMAPSWPWSWVQRVFGSSDPRLSARVGVPAWTVSGQNELQMRFDMRPLHRGDCVAVPTDTRAGIDPDSTIDLSGAHRFAVLPNLAFFTSAGFPFTRLADLSETAALLPDRPNSVELSAFFGMIGRLAAHVGHPATGLTVVRGGTDFANLRDRDLIVVGALGRQPALAMLLRAGATSPLRIEGGRLIFALPDALSGIREIFTGAPRQDRTRIAADLANTSEGLGALVAFESPLRSGRSVVALTGATPAGMEAMLAVLRDPERVGRIQGDIAMVTASGQVTSYRASPTYSHGTLPVWLWPQYYMGGQPLLILAALGLGALLLALPMHRALRRRAAARLRARSA